MSCGCGGMVRFSPEVSCGTLDLISGADYMWSERLTYPSTHPQAGQDQPWPAGQLFYRFFTEPVETKWMWTISGAVASIKVESEDVAKVPDRTRFHLVWLPAGELAGGQVLAVGKVRVVK